jgi:hypothetical protein
MFVPRFVCTHLWSFLRCVRVEHGLAQGKHYFREQAESTLPASGESHIIPIKYTWNRH